MLTLVAPLAGWLGPLTEVPDAVFASGMTGDGMAIDPTSMSLQAPCAASVVAVHAARHAVTLRADNGAELLLHLGIDTVALGGRGFTVHVDAGARVAAGDRLIGFDLDLIAEQATSLVTPIIITNGDAFAIARRAVVGAVAVGDWLMDLVPLEPAAAMPIAAVTAPDEEVIEQSVVICIAHGLHARPAATIAAVAKGFSATTELHSGKARANAKSTVAIMALGLRGGDVTTVSTRGCDSALAVAAVVAAIEGLADAPASVAPASVPPRDQASSNGVIRGITAAGGLAIGVAVQIDSATLAPPVTGAGPVAENARLDAAISAVRASLYDRTAGGNGAAAAIFAAHLEVLDDPEITAMAWSAIATGASAGAAWRRALAGPIAALEAVADPRIAARAADLRDLDRQVVAATLGAVAPDIALPERAVVLAHDLLPSQLMALDARRLVAIVTAAGGPTSHVAIIAAAMNLPAVFAAGPAVLEVADGTSVIVDGDAATLKVDPSSAEVDVATKRITSLRRHRDAARVAAADDCRMADGTRIEVFANLGGEVDAEAAITAGAEGCGLLRTELMFLDRAAPPDEDEQTAAYQAIATALGDRPLIIRTLDIGGDKPVAYLSIPREDNPALGLRGIRVGLWRPDLLRTQLRAVLRVVPAGQCRILLPMIASVSELLAVRAMVEEIAPADRTPIGVMIETPAAAVTAELLAAHADFFAIGTNDLAQYTLAMDRGNASVSGMIDALHPAVLRLISQAVTGAAVYTRPVGVCGGLASDLAAVPILIGLGVTELSAVPALIPEVKALVRTLTLPACVDLARRAMATTSAAEVRALAAVTS